MNGDFEIVFDAKLVEKVLDKLGKEAEANLAKIALKAANSAVGIIRRQIMAKLAHHPSGALARSVKAVLVESRGAVVAAIAGPTRVYARIQNDGGTINAHGKLLAVPLSFAGVPRGKAPRDWGSDALKLIPRKGKDSLLAMNTKGPLRPMYVLKQAVRIHPTNFVEASAEAAQPTIEEILAVELTALVAKAAA